MKRKITIEEEAKAKAIIEAINTQNKPIENGNRSLQAKWSIELEQDLMNMQGINIDRELSSAMAYEIQAEIDRDIITRMLNISSDSKYDKLVKPLMRQQYNSSTFLDDIINVTPMDKPKGLTQPVKLERVIEVYKAETSRKITFDE